MRVLLLSPCDSSLQCRRSLSLRGSSSALSLSTDDSLSRSFLAHMLRAVVSSKLLNRKTNSPRARSRSDHRIFLFDQVLQPKNTQPYSIIGGEHL